MWYVYVILKKELPVKLTLNLLYELSMALTFETWYFIHLHFCISYYILLNRGVHRRPRLGCIDTYICTLHIYTHGYTRIYLSYTEDHIRAQEQEIVSLRGRWDWGGFVKRKHSTSELVFTDGWHTQTNIRIKHKNLRKKENGGITVRCVFAFGGD